MTLYPNLIIDALRGVRYPGNGKSIVELGMIADNMRIDGMKVCFGLVFDKSTDPFIRSLIKTAEAAIHTNVSPDVEVTITPEFKRDVEQKVNPLPKVKNIIGVSSGKGGVGKSTVASLLLGRHDPQSGTLTIGGRPLCEIAEDDLLEHVTYIGHDSFFFKGTVRENLCLAVPSLTASDEVLWDVLERCALAGSLRSEDGLDTPLLENASNLSGGQRQRLALARAILHDSDVYIFDEATSSIDIESEEAILAEIHALAKEKTVILISHRLANVADADIIYCMADGRVTESGTHDALLQNGGAYASLWKTQQALETYGKEAAV